MARVDAVWRDLMPRIDAATSSLTRAEALCNRLEMRLPEVRLARQRLDAVRSSVSDDPLSLSKNVGPDLDALVSDAARAAGNIERAHGSLDTDLAATDVQLTQLRVLRARAAAAFSEAVVISSASASLRAWIRRASARRSVSSTWFMISRRLPGKTRSLTSARVISTASSKRPS